MRRYLIIALIGVLMGLASCRDKDLDMTLLTKTLYEDAVFDALYAEDAWNVILVQNSLKRGVELEYSAFLEEYLQIRKDGSMLDMRFTQRLNLPNATVKNATVYVPSLRQVTLREAATVDLQGSFAGDSLVLDLKEATTLRGGLFLGNLAMELDDASTVVEFSAEGEACSLILRNASVFKGILSFSETMDLTVSEASRMTTYGGNAPVATVTVEEASFLNMTPTAVGKMLIHLRSTSEASVRVTALLEGTVEDGSTLYHAGPANLQVECDETSSMKPL